MSAPELEPWKRQPPCNICNQQHAGYEKAHIDADDHKDYSANFAPPTCSQCGIPISEHPVTDACELAGNEEAEFTAWYDAEIEPQRGPFSFREIALRAFRQGLALGREGRA